MTEGERGAILAPRRTSPAASAVAADSSREHRARARPALRGPELGGGDDRSRRWTGGIPPAALEGLKTKDVGRDLVPGVSAWLEGRIRSVRDEVGIAKADFDRMTEERRAVLARRRQQADAAVSQAGAAGENGVAHEGQQSEAQIAAERRASDLRTEQTLAAARGENDPTVVHMRRDRRSRR